MLVLGDPPPAQAIVENLPRRCQSFGHLRQRRILHADIHASLHNRGARDPGAHEASAHNPQSPYLAGRWRVLDAQILLELGGGEKDLNELA